jgi:ribose transport system permease protein
MILLFIICIIINPSFLDGGSISALLYETSIFGFLVLAQALVVLTGGIDLSVGNMASMSSVVAVWSMIMFKNILPNVMNIPLSIIIALLFCGIIGLFSGLCVAYLKITPLIATLGTTWIVQGIGYFLLKGVPTPFPYSEFITFMKGKAFYIPYAFLFFVAIAIIEVFILNKTRMGRRVYAVGGNTYAAYISGIRVNYVKLGVYTMSAVLSGIAGILVGAYSSVGYPRACTGYELYAIAAIVMGGIPFSGGEGNLWNTLIAMLTLRILNKIVLFSGLSGYFEGMVVGAVLLLTLVLNTRNSGIFWKTRRLLKKSAASGNNSTGGEQHV